MELTYESASAHVCRMAAVLLERGVAPGSTAAVLTTPRPDSYALFLAMNLIGVTWVGLNPRHTRREMEYVISDSEAAAIFYLPKYEDRHYVPDVEYLAANCPSIRLTMTIEELFAASPATEQPEDLGSTAGPESVTMLVYTSGTTGKPKGVQLYNRAMLHRSQVQWSRWPTRRWPVCYTSSPLDHIGGIHFIPFYTLIGGGTLVFAERLEPDKVPELVEKYSVTSLLAGSPLFQRILRSPAFSLERFASVERCVFLGAEMAPTDVELLYRIGAVATGYGMSETTGSVAFSEDGTPSELLAKIIGKPLEEEVRIMHAEGRPCEANEVGEIQVLPVNCMKGYLNRAEATASAYTDDGWFRTGDIVELLESGDLVFRGRTSDMYKSGGYNIYPREVEAVLLEHEEISQAFVVGIPDPAYSEVGAAFVITRVGSTLTPESIRAWCKERMANYKVPKRVIFIEEVPLLRSGKTDKQSLRRLITEEQGLIYDYGDHAEVR